MYVTLQSSTCFEHCNVTYIFLMNKELCIKVGKWNKSSLRTVISEPRSEPGISEYVAEMLLTRTLWMFKLYKHLWFESWFRLTHQTVEISIVFIAIKRRNSLSHRLMEDGIYWEVKRWKFTSQGCHAVSVGKQLPTAWRSVVPKQAMDFFILKIVAYIPGDLNLRQHRCKNLKYSKDECP
jgi:hypothetical protein